MLAVILVSDFKFYGEWLSGGNCILQTQEIGFPLVIGDCSDVTRPLRFTGH